MFRSLKKLVSLIIPEGAWEPTLPTELIFPYNYSAQKLLCFTSEADVYLTKVMFGPPERDERFNPLTAGVAYIQVFIFL